MSRAILLLLPLLVFAQAAAAQNDDAGNLQYNTALEVYKAELYKAAAGEWQKFVENHPAHPYVAHGYLYLGTSHFKNGDLEPALVAFQKLVQDHPKFEQLDIALFNLGLTQFNLAIGGKKELYAEASKTFASLVQQFPKSSRAAEAVFYQGECAFDLEQPEQAAALFGQFLKDNPKHAKADRATYSLGVSQQKLEKFGAAGDTYAAFLKSFPKHRLAAEVRMRLGETLFSRQQFAEAEAQFLAAAKAEFELADLNLMLLGDALAARQKFAEAAAAYLSVPQKFPQAQNVDLKVAWLEGGKCAYRAGDLAAARQALSNLLSAGGEVGSEAAHWVAQTYLKEMKPAEALQTAEAAIANAGGTKREPDLLLDRADALYELEGRRKDAATAYAEIAAKFPASEAAEQASYMAAFAALNAGEHQAALTSAQAFLQARPDSKLAAQVKYVAAEANVQLGQFQPAGEIYADLLAKHPQHADVEMWKVRLGLTAHRQKKWQEAAAALAPLVDSLKTPALKAEALYLLGSSQVQLEQYDAAKKSLAAAVAADADWRQADETLLFLSHAERLSGDLKSAALNLEQLCKKFPNSPVLDQARYWRGECLYNTGDLAGAAAEYEQAAQVADSKLIPEALYGLAWSKLGAKQVEPAEQTFTALIDKYPEHRLAPLSRYARGSARRQLGKHAEAEADLQAFLATNPSGKDRVGALHELGRAQTGLKQSAEAAATLRQLLSESPEYSQADEVRYDLAWALKSQEKNDEATAAFAELAEKHPDSAFAGEALFFVGEANFAKEDYAAASKSFYAAEKKIKSLAEAGKLDDAKRLSWGDLAAYKLGWAYFLDNELDNAQKTFGYQQRAYPDGKYTAHARTMQAEALFKQDNFKEAMPIYEAALKSPVEELAATATLHAAQCANQLGQYDQAAALVKDFAAKFPQANLGPEADYEIAWALHRQEKFDEAAKLFEAVEKATSREVAAKARFMIGEIQFEKKQHEDAVVSFFRVAYAYGFPKWQANALYEAGRCLEVLGKSEQAKKSYNEIVSKHAESDKAPLAKKRLKALGG